MDGLKLIATIYVLSPLPGFVNSDCVAITYGHDAVSLCHVYETPGMTDEEAVSAFRQRDQGEGQ